MTPLDNVRSVEEISKALHRRALRDSGLRLGIVHVMKTAGTSLRVLLGQSGQTYVGPGYMETNPNFHAFSDWDTTGLSMMTNAEAVRQQFTRYPSVMGHITAHSYLAAGATHLLLTVREPRSRLLSLFRYFELSPEATEHAGAFGKAMRESTRDSISEFLALCPANVHTTNAIVQFALCAPDEPAAGVDLPARVKQALPTLFAAHWSGDGAETIQSIEQLLQMPIAPAGMPRLNEARVQPGMKPRTLSQLDLMRLRECTALDSWLLEELMTVGLLRRRDQIDLDAEFYETAHRLGFVFDGVA